MFVDRVLSGMRPTGSLHLGHYHGVLKNWVRLQHEFQCLFFVADWHALTTHYDTPEIIEQNVWDMVIDWLAAGVEINMVLMVLNLLPVPPLDGGRIAVSLLPHRLAHWLARLEPYGLVILLALLFTGLLEKIIGPVIASGLRFAGWAVGGSP